MCACYRGLTVVRLNFWRACIAELTLWRCVRSVFTKPKENASNACIRKFHSEMQQDAVLPTTATMCLYLEHSRYAVG